MCRAIAELIDHNASKTDPPFSYINEAENRQLPALQEGR